jgi:hypothetical protein
MVMSHALDIVKPIPPMMAELPSTIANIIRIFELIDFSIFMALLVQK